MQRQKFYLHLMGRKEPLGLEQEAGQKLSLVLMQSNLPKFIFLFGDIIAISSIRHLEVKEYFVKDELLPQTESETLEKYNQMKQKFIQRTEFKQIK